MFKDWTYRDWMNNYLAFMVLISIVFPHFFGLSVVPYLVLIVLGFRRGKLAFKMNALGLLFILLYFIYAMGLILGWREGQEVTSLEYKLSFLLVPLLLAFRHKEGGFSLERIASGLLLGVCIVSIYGFFHALSCYLSKGTIDCFLTVSISPIHHPSYFMAFMIVSMFFAWLGWKRKWKYYSLWWILPFTFLGLVMHLLSLSLAGILFMLLAIIALSIYGIYKRFGRYVALGSLVILPLLGYLFVTKVPQVEGEWSSAKWYADVYMQDPEGFVRNTPYPASGSELRLILWTVAWQELKTHPFGVGTGNIDEALGRQLRHYGQVEMAKKRLNPHNQFLQTGVEIGWIGLGLLVGIMGFTVYLAFKNRSALLLLLVSCLAFHCLFESMLQRQSGIVFFTFWICVVAIIVAEERKVERLEDANSGSA